MRVAAPAVDRAIGRQTATVKSPRGDGREPERCRPGSRDVQRGVTFGDGAVAERAQPPAIDRVVGGHAACVHAARAQGGE